MHVLVSPSLAKSLSAFRDSGTLKGPPEIHDGFSGEILSKLGTLSAVSTIFTGIIVKPTDQSDNP